MQTFSNTAALLSLLYLTLTTDSRSSASSAVTDGVSRFKCFICHWTQNSDRCGDNTFSLDKEESGKYMINCTACYKKVKRSSSGEKDLILRGCDLELPHYELKCQYFYYSDRSYEETCTCASEYCNGENSTSQSQHLIVVAGAILAAVFNGSLL